MFPDNLFHALYQHIYTVFVHRNDTNGLEGEIVRELRYRSGTNVMGIVLFSLTFGALLGTVGTKGQIVIDFFRAMFETVMKMFKFAIWLTPVSVSSVIVGKTLGVNNLGSIFSQLLWFICTVAIGLLLYQLVFVQLIYFLFLRKNPYKFYSKLISPLITGLATNSG